MINLDYFLRELKMMKKSFWLVLLTLIFGFNTPIFEDHDGSGEHCKMHKKNHLMKQILIVMERLIVKKPKPFARKISMLCIKITTGH
jgi:hypothetical protein